MSPRQEAARREDSFGIGVIADVQYADAPDGTNFAKTTIRHFRGALRVLRSAVDYWNGRAVQLVANLGDTIDGRCAGLNQSESATAAVLAEFARCQCKDIVHLIGNHDLYNFASRDELDRRLGTRDEQGLEYRCLEPRSDLRLILLDPYRVSLLWPPEHPQRDHARAILAQRNPNDVETSGENWFNGLKGHDRRFVPFNGGLGQEQIRWLRTQLEAARLAGQRALLLSHVPVHPGSCDGTTMLWDFDEVLPLLEEFRGSVAGVLAGHDHKGGYVHDGGIHHITFKSPLNRGDEGACFGYLEVGDGELVISGPALGDLLDRELLERGSSQGNGGHVRLEF